MTFEINEHHFVAQETNVDHRPKLLSQTSTGSIFADATTAISDSTIDGVTVLGNRDGNVSSSDHRSIASNRPTLQSMESDLVTSMSLALSADESTDQALSKHGVTHVLGEELRTGDSVDDADLSAEQVAGLTEEEQLADFLGRKKHFLILSAAGKSIYARHGTEQVISGYMGILQAIMGFYQESTTPDVLHSFSSPSLNVVMLVKGPIYLVVISKYAERESTLRGQLEFLYNVVVSSLTSTTMTRTFDRGDNFDLGRLLGGSEKFMDKICDGMTFQHLQFDILFNSLAVLRLRATQRQQLNNILANYRPQQASLLYAMLAVDKKLVSVLRPKGHSLYPADLKLVFETIWERGFEGGQDYWFPLCLPKFNSTGYLHIFVSFLAPSVVMVLIAADKDDFFELQTMKTNVLKKMNKEGLVRDLTRARFSQVTTEMLCIDGEIEHFVFKSKTRFQYLAPDLIPKKRVQSGPHSDQPISRHDLLRIYEDLQDLHGTRHKLQIHHYDLPLCGMGEERKVLALSWITSDFELFVISKPMAREEADSAQRVPALIGSSNVIHQFIRREEGRVWLHDGLTF